tara:strand:+ start:1655 stop:2524 length:870 start_codon:yes stop_codon:yes gene_type:complete
MKAFLKNILVFTLLLACFNIALLILIQNIYVNDYYTVQLNYKEYLLADSHGYNAGDLRETNGIYNLSETGDSYIDLERKLRFLIRNSSVEKIYLTVDDHTLSPSREDFNNKEISVFYTNSEDYSNYLTFINKKYLNRYVVFFNSKYSSVIRHFFKNKFTSFTSENKEPIPWSDLSKTEKKAKSKQRFETYFSEKEGSETLTESLIRMIQLCKENNIELIGIKFPVSSSYNQILGTQSYDADKIFRKNELDILDFKKSLLKNDTFFRDQDHLSNAGEIKFKSLLLKMQNK